MRFDGGLHPVLQDLSEEILELGTSKIDQDFLPIWGVLVSPQVWLALSAQNLECCRFSDTIGTNEAQDLSRTRSRQTMKLERVWTKPMSGVPLQVLGEIDNVDGFERTLFHTNTASCVHKKRRKIQVGVLAERADPRRVSAATGKRANLAAIILTDTQRL